MLLTTQWGFSEKLKHSNEFIVLIYRRQKQRNQRKKYLPTMVGGINNSLVFLLYFHALMPGIPGAVNRNVRSSMKANCRIVLTQPATQEKRTPPVRQYFVVLTSVEPRFSAAP